MSNVFEKNRYLAKKIENDFLVLANSVLIAEFSDVFIIFIRLIVVFLYAV